jgi:hypothetical protein
MEEKDEEEENMEEHMEEHPTAPAPPTVQQPSDPHDREDIAASDLAGHTDDEAQAASDFEVEDIVDMARAVDGTDMFRIRWRGYPPSADTWEPAANLLNAQRKLEEFIRAWGSEPIPTYEFADKTTTTPGRGRRRRRQRRDPTTTEVEQEAIEPLSTTRRGRRSRPPVRYV